MASFIPVLRRTLVKLYDEIKLIEIVSDDLGVKNARIPWQNAAVVVWHEILKEYRKMQGQDDQSIYLPLLERVREDYARDRSLLEIENGIRGVANELEQQLQKIGVDTVKIGSMDLVNCDRYNESADYWSDKQQMIKKVGLKTAIIVAPFEQNPLSLAERLVLEYIAEMNDDNNAVFMDRDPQTSRIRSLLIEPKTTEGLDLVLNTYFEELTHNRKLSKYTAVAHILEINAEMTKGIHEVLYSQIRDRFRSFSEDKEVLNLLFMVTPVYDVSVVKKISQQISPWASSDPGISLYDALDDVSYPDIKAWFGNNGARQLETVDAFMNTFFDIEKMLPTKQTFSTDKKVNQQSMELIQEQIYQYALKQGLQDEST